MSWALIPLTEEQREIQRTARDFARAEIAPYSDAWDRAESGIPRVQITDNQYPVTNYLFCCAFLAQARTLDGCSFS